MSAGSELPGLCSDAAVECKDRLKAGEVRETGRFQSLEGTFPRVTFWAEGVVGVAQV